MSSSAHTVLVDSPDCEFLSCLLTPCHSVPAHNPAWVTHLVPKAPGSSATSLSTPVPCQDQGPVCSPSQVWLGDTVQCHLPGMMWEVSLCLGLTFFHSMSHHSQDLVLQGCGWGCGAPGKGLLLYWGVLQGPNLPGSRETPDTSSMAPGTISCAGCCHHPSLPGCPSYP